MRFRIHIYPDGLGNPDQSNAYELGEAEASSRDEVAATLDATINEQGETFIPSDWDYVITEVL